MPDRMNGISGMNDVREIKKIIITEFNIEGNCTEQKFADLVLETKPHR